MPEGTFGCERLRDGGAQRKNVPDSKSNESNTLLPSYICLAICRPLRRVAKRGATRIRTGDGGFAIRCLRPLGYGALKAIWTIQGPCFGLCLPIQRDFSWGRGSCQTECFRTVVPKREPIRSIKDKFGQIDEKSPDKIGSNDQTTKSPVV